MTYQYDVDLTADAKVAAWVLREFRDAMHHVGHLATCEQTAVRFVEGNDGMYGCDTGCDYARLEATLTCPHGESQEFEYGQFGELADLLDDIG